MPALTASDWSVVRIRSAQTGMAGWATAVHDVGSNSTVGSKRQTCRLFERLPMMRMQRVYSCEPSSFLLCRIRQTESFEVVTIYDTVTVSETLEYPLR
eukprot:1178878-Prorocentrum_minimum.AAC.1